MSLDFDMQVKGSIPSQGFSQGAVNYKRPIIQFMNYNTDSYLSGSVFTAAKNNSIFLYVHNTCRTYTFLGCIKVRREALGKTLDVTGLRPSTMSRRRFY